MSRTRTGTHQERNAPMESTKKRVGRPKSEPRTGPLVLEGVQKRETILTEVSADTAEELSAYAAWVRESAPAKLTPAEAMSKTIDFAVRDLLSRDKCWQAYKRTGGRAVGTGEIQPSAPAATPAASLFAAAPERPPHLPLSHRRVGVTVGLGRRPAAEDIHHLELERDRKRVSEPVHPGRRTRGAARAERPGRRLIGGRPIRVVSVSARWASAFRSTNCTHQLREER